MASLEAELREMDRKVMEEAALWRRLTPSERQQRQREKLRLRDVEEERAEREIIERQLRQERELWARLNRMLRALFEAVFRLRKLFLSRFDRFREPGTLLDRIAAFWFSGRKYERVLRPLLDDMQREYAEAKTAKRPGKAFVVRLRGTCAFWSATGLLKFFKWVMRWTLVSRFF
jgi:hypothetical protein